MSCYFIYMIRTHSGTLYTGITVDLERRLRQHSQGKKGSRYLRAVRPRELAAAWKLEAMPECQPEDRSQVETSEAASAHSPSSRNRVGYSTSSTGTSASSVPGTTSAQLRSIASKLESRIKALDRKQKLQLIEKPSRIKMFDLLHGYRCRSLHAFRRSALQRSLSDI